MLKKVLVLGIFIILMWNSLAIASITKAAFHKNFVKSQLNGQVVSIQQEKKFIDKIAEIIQRINESLLKKYLTKLVELGPRTTGTYGCFKAGEYIYNQFKNMNLTVRYHYWSRWSNKWNTGKYSDRNVEAILPGTNRSSDMIFVFNAHYDSVEVSPGADDDGSGVAAVLAVANILSQYEFEHTIRFVTFSGEEQGLLGSDAYVRDSYEHNENIVIEINADGIGYAKTKEDGNKVRLYHTRGASWAANIAENISKNYNIQFNFSRGVLSGRRGGSDYFSFYQYGYDTIAFFEGKWNPYWHTSNDSLEHVNFTYLVKMTKLIAGTLAKLADMPEVYPKIKIVSPKRGRLYVDGREKLQYVPKGNTIIIDNIWIWADVETGKYNISRVEFYLDDELKYIDTSYPFKWRFDEHVFFKHKITVIAYDEKGNSDTDEMYITIFNTRHDL
jgi:hypothetical protein